jgi:hypothetical protein
MRHAARRIAARGAALVAAVALVALPLPAAAADTVEFTISERDITESSGLARDTNSSLYWTVNDSGDGGVVYGLRPDGSLRGTLKYRAKPVDVEAVAMAGSRLYVADIGDNQATRDFVTVYAFGFPTAQNQTVSYNAYDFSYPDGPHDAETLLVDGSGRLYLVTKEAAGGIYAAPQQPSGQGVNRLERVGDAPAYVTDGVFLPEQNLFALRTYLTVETLAADGYQPVGRATLPLQPQGESIALSLDGSALLVGSEGRSSKVFRVPVPSSLAAAPSAPATPPASSPAAAPSPTPTAQPDSGDTAAEDPNAGRGRAGTFWALGLAGVVAVVAGAVVVLAKKP